MSDYSKVDLVNTGTLNSDTSRAIAMTAAQGADDRKAGDIVLLGVAEVSYLADYFVMATGFSRVQVRAISQSVQDKIEIEWQRLPLRVEGQAEGSWVLLDYGEVIVHVLMAKEREFYNLEAFWGHAERIEFSAAGPGRE
ncbi:ribosome silencing factor [Microcoleus sp. FACHB-672]|uniref:ribosome silencing factor n=1 Tax=Microcoleus sp. FACHB-672 TaxID=2692825 RepID=UPI001688952A|nr:ribosome silencing factor [Microcoleus sp. FACHB-672]MBD2042783.1 ribosome silencing factor [Microcoleus sp. FACHB-672]